MMEEDIKFAVLDASYILAYLMPDEEVEDVADAFNRYRNKDLSFIAPQILPFEVVNGVKSAYIARRITLKHAQQVIDDYFDVKITLAKVDFQINFTLALEKKLSIYDSSYIYLSSKFYIPLLTLDKRLQTLIDPKPLPFTREFSDKEISDWEKEDTG